MLAVLQQPGPTLGKPASTTDSAYLLTGMALCPCGSGLTVRSRSHGRKRASFYRSSAGSDPPGQSMVGIKTVVNRTAILTTRVVSENSADTQAARW